MFFHNVDGIKLVEGKVSNDYNKLHLSFASAKDKIVENGDEEVDDDECVSSQVDDVPIEDGNLCQENNTREEDFDENDKKWKVSRRLDDGRLTFIHIRQAVKLLLPREYIARCRQKRHWAARYLPGKAPIDPKHDIVKFCDVAIKSMDSGVKCFDIGRIEVLQSTRDGSEIVSFQLLKGACVRFRCSLYYFSVDDNTYRVSEEVVLTAWKSASSLIGPVELVADSTRKGCYSLHQQSGASL